MTILYELDKKGGFYIKRFTIEQFIIGKAYELVPEGAKVLDFTVREDEEFVFKYKKKPRLKILEERFPVGDYLVKSVRAQGVRLTTKDTSSIRRVRIRKNGKSSGNGDGRK
jgi:topoisomerase-4 subunit A